MGESEQSHRPFAGFHLKAGQFFAAFPCSRIADYALGSEFEAAWVWHPSPLYQCEWPIPFPWTPYSSSSPNFTCESSSSAPPNLQLQNGFFLPRWRRRRCTKTNLELWQENMKTSWKIWNHSRFVPLLSTSRWSASWCSTLYQIVSRLCWVFHLFVGCQVPRNPKSANVH